MVKITDLTGNFDSNVEILKAVEKAREHQRATDLALGLTRRDITLKSEHYRAILRPSAEVRQSIADLVASKNHLQANIDSIRQMTRSLAVSPAVADYLKNHIRITESYAASSEALKYVREQSEAMRTSVYGLRSCDFATLREIDRNRFGVPASAVLSAQFKGIDTAQLHATSRLLGLDQTRTLRAAEALRAPWMEAADSIGSFTRFAELYSIGKAVRLKDAYSEQVSSALRASLGDYRDAITADPSALGDFHVRTELYIDRGLDRDLTDLPEDAFEETLDVTEIRGEAPPLVTFYGSPIPAVEDEEAEAGFRRNN